MRRVLLVSALAAAALSGTGGATASAEGPLDCNHPWFSGLCTTVNATYDAAVGSVSGPQLDCNHPWYSGLCDTIDKLIGQG